jgi:hypothetical protein
VLLLQVEDRVKGVTHDFLLWGVRAYRRVHCVIILVRNFVYETISYWNCIQGLFISTSFDAVFCFARSHSTTPIVTSRAFNTSENTSEIQDADIVIKLSEHQ